MAHNQITPETRTARKFSKQLVRRSTWVSNHTHSSDGLRRGCWELAFNAELRSAAGFPPQCARAGFDHEEPIPCQPLRLWLERRCRAVTVRSFNLTQEGSFTLSTQPPALSPARPERGCHTCHTHTHIKSKRLKEQKKEMSKSTCIVTVAWAKESQMTQIGA